MLHRLLASLPPTQRVVEIWVDGTHTAVRVWDTLARCVRVYTLGKVTRSDAWWMHATRSTGKEPRDLVRARESEQKRIDAQMRRVSTTLRASFERLSDLAWKHCGKIHDLDGFDVLQERVRAILNYSTKTIESKIPGNAHLVLILDTKDEIKAKRDILSTFSHLPSYKNVHLNMYRKLASVYFSDTVDAIQFIGKSYPSIKEVRKGYDWTKPTIVRKETTVICPDVKDIDTMESLQKEVYAAEKVLQVKSMPPPGVGVKRKFKFIFS